MPTRSRRITTPRKPEPFITIIKPTPTSFTLRYKSHQKPGAAGQRLFQPHSPVRFRRAWWCGCGGWNHRNRIHWHTIWPLDEKSITRHKGGIPQKSRSQGWAFKMLEFTQQEIKENRPNVYCNDSPGSVASANEVTSWARKSDKFLLLENIRKNTKGSRKSTHNLFNCSDSGSDLKLEFYGKGRKW